MRPHLERALPAALSWFTHIGVDATSNDTGVTAAELDLAANRIVFTPAEVAGLLGVSKATVYRWITAEQIPVVQLGDSRKFIPKRPLLEMFGLLGTS